MPTKDEILFTLLNNLPYSGRQGEAKPDWLAWGAQAFSVISNGDFWVLDSAADPPRLLRIVPPNDISQTVNLEGFVIGAADVEVSHDAVWVLGVASLPPRVVKFATNGSYLASYDLPEGLWSEDGLTGIALAEDSTLLVELMGGASLYRLFDQTGEIVPVQVEGYIYGGHLFRSETRRSSDTGFVQAGDVRVEVTVEHNLVELWVLGVGRDGSFYVNVVDMEEEPVVSLQREIHRYSAAGELLGIARPHPSAIYAKQDLVVGPDGWVYQLVSNPDHSVQIVRLGFQSDALVRALPSPTSTLTPTSLIPLLPTWTVTPAKASDLDRARHTLLTFFSLLHEGRYAEAAPLYGGPYDWIRDANPDIPSEDYTALWESVCTRQTLCLLVADIFEEKQIAEDEFEFWIGFVWRDGTLLKSGPCCGATEAEVPLVWQFRYTVKKIDGEFRVMEMPVYLG